ncbi:hypothetical protein [Nocardioides plantarum]|uniref:HTTM-like domain-containing protein n=1 Tax=Nocardioides plantarum TaxID=29299 RepID=A0ABV5KBE1_9ACTN|nr:hypothetical protein [Nocardioides plantarum]
MSSYLTLDQAFQLTALVGSLGVGVASLEFLTTYRSYAAGGLYSWAIAGERQFLVRRPLVWRIGNRLLDTPGVWFLLGLRLLSAAWVACAVVVDGSIPPVGAALLLLTSLAVSFRHSYGLDGSDQMSLIIVTATAVYAWSPVGSFAGTAAIAFIAAQSCLSYLASGVAKAVSPTWRRGEAVGAIVNTSTYGRRDVAALLAAKPLLGQLLTWGVVAFECTFLAAALVGGPTAIAFFIAGALMHVGIAICMGLNTFLWAFLATYPAIYYCSQLIH